MKLAIEMFSMVIVITLSCILFSSIISGDNQMADARDFHHVVVNRIEDSNCNAKVMAECREEAKQRGYELEIKEITIYEENPGMLVVLKYKVVLPIFQMFGGNFEKQAVIEGYAR